MSHHPLITACHAEGEGFTLWHTGQVKSKFWGKSIELTPQGYVHVTLPERGDHFVWNEITSCMHNVISGKKWIEMYGEMTIKNLTTGEWCRLNFKESSFFSTAKNDLVGTVHDSQGQKVRFLSGRWNEALYEQVDEHQLYCLWRASPSLSNPEMYYGFTEFAFSLNQLTDKMKATLPLTDSRFRHDIRLVEEGHLDEADRVKANLEQRQRDLGREFGEGHSPSAFSKHKHSAWQPLWFEAKPLISDPLTGRQKSLSDDAVEYVSNGKYWEARENHQYPKSFFHTFTT